jgi:hypothetical protein
MGECAAKTIPLILDLTYYVQTSLIKTMTLGLFIET